MNHSRVGRAVVWGLAAAMAGACVPVPDPVLSAGLSAAQAGTSAFIQGELRAAVRVPIGEVFEAAKAAIGEPGLGFEVRDVELRGAAGVLTCRETSGGEPGGNDRVIEIKLRKSTAAVTLITIQAGTFGDQPLSRLVLDEIRRKLDRPAMADDSPK